MDGITVHVIDRSDIDPIDRAAEIKADGFVGRTDIVLVFEVNPLADWGSFEYALYPDWDGLRGDVKDGMITDEQMAEAMLINDRLVFAALQHPGLRGYFVRPIESWLGR